MVAGDLQKSKLKALEEAGTPPRLCSLINLVSYELLLYRQKLKRRS